MLGEDSLPAPIDVRVAPVLEVLLDVWELVQEVAEVRLREVTVVGQWSALPGATSADRTRAFVTFGLGALVVLAASAEVREETAVLGSDVRAALLEVIVVVDPSFPRCDHLQEFGSAFVGRRACPGAAECLQRRARIEQSTDMALPRACLPGTHSC